MYNVDINKQISIKKQNISLKLIFTLKDLALHTISIIHIYQVLYVCSNRLQRGCNPSNVFVTELENLIAYIRFARPGLFNLTPFVYWIHTSQVWNPFGQLSLHRSESCLLIPKYVTTWKSRAACLQTLKRILLSKSLVSKLY